MFSYCKCTILCTLYMWKSTEKCMLLYIVLFQVKSQYVTYSDYVNFAQLNCNLNEYDVWIDEEFMEKKECKNTSRWCFLSEINSKRNIKY